MQKILLIDDDDAFRKSLRLTLEDAGYTVAEARNGREGIRKTAEETPGLVILDLVMPGLAGPDVCLSLKKEPSTSGIPVLILTGNDQDGQDIACLDLGADDYLTKPVRGERLLAHCRAILRRGWQKDASPEPRAVTLGELRLDYGRKVAALGAKEHSDLTPKEFDLLYALALASPSPRQREELYRQVWGNDPPSEQSLRTVEVHVRRIRLKLGWRTDQWLTAVSGRGYSLAPPAK